MSGKKVVGRYVEIGIAEEREGIPTFSGVLDALSLASGYRSSATEIVLDAISATPCYAAGGT